MRIILYCLFLLTAGIVPACAQSIIFDAGHFLIVNENGAVRESAENTHQNYLETIRQDADNINLNITTLAFLQDMVRNSLVNVNGTLKNGLAVRQAVAISAEIVTQSGQLLAMARGDPWLLLFAESTTDQLKNRAVRLVTEVSDFILKEGDNVLMDYGKRDLLLRKVVLELKVMRALVYSMYKSMYWAKINGLLQSANPFAAFINQDKRLADQLFIDYKTLKQ